MRRYANLSGESGVEAYAIGAKSIHVKFRGNARVYEYSHASAGAANVTRMKHLADSGRGLATFISQHVADRYVR